MKMNLRSVIKFMNCSIIKYLLIIFFKTIRMTIPCQQVTHYCQQETKFQVGEFEP